MNDLIETFFQTKFTEEMQENLYSAIGLFTLFGYVEPMGEVVDLIMRDGYEAPENIADGVTGIISRAVDRLLHENRVTVLPEVTFRERIKILEGIYALTRIEDPSNFLPLFDGWLNNEEIFARVIGDVLSVPYEDIFVQLQFVFEGTIARMKEFFEDIKVENETVEFALLKKIRKNLRVFFKVFGSPSLVEALNEMNMIKGQKFQSYINLLRDEVLNPDDMESTCYALLWLALISEDGQDNVKLFLMEQAKDLFLEVREQTLFNQMLTKALGVYLPTLEVEV